MSHLDTTLTINIDSMLKYCLKNYAVENHLTMSQVVRKYILQGFEGTNWGNDYKNWWMMRDYEENPEEYQIDTEAVAKAMQEVYKEQKGEKHE